MGRAVVIGAGPAGTVAALALQEAGWEPAIYEAYERSAGLSQGVFLTIAVNGLDALSVIGADDVVRELGFPTGNIRFSSGSGKDLGALPIGPRLNDGTVTRSLRRADLYAALSDLALERGIAIHHGKRLHGASCADGTVSAAFADGTSAIADLLIGADGLRSTVRPQIDPSAPSPRYAGMGNIGALTRSATLDVSREAADGDYRMIWGRRCFFGYTVSRDGEIWWFANPPARRELTPGQLRDPRSIKRQLLDLLSLDHSPAAQIVAGTADHEILAANQYELPRVPVWHRDRMVVIGDAAHAVSPATGQGVSRSPAGDLIMASFEHRRGDLTDGLIGDRGRGPFEHEQPRVGDLPRERLAVADREERILAPMYHERRDRELGQALTPARLAVELGEHRSHLVGHLDCGLRARRAVPDALGGHARGGGVVAQDLRAGGGELCHGSAVGPVGHGAREQPVHRRSVMVRQIVIWPARCNGPRPGEGERRERVRVVERGDLGDHPADADARQLRRPVVESAAERRGVGCEIAQRVRRRLGIDGDRRAAIAQVVAHDVASTASERFAQRVGPGQHGRAARE